MPGPDGRTAALEPTASSLSLAGLSRHEQAVSLRWVLLHMLDEVARHNGHADLIRGSIDGAIGY